MMVEIIPTINVDSFEEVERRIKLVEPYTKWAQIDVADGTFTKNTIWHNAPDLLNLKTKLSIEVHLMIAPIEKRIENWLLPSVVKRIIFHIEAGNDIDFVVEKCRAAGIEPGIAINPDTSWTRLVPHIERVGPVRKTANDVPDAGDAKETQAKGLSNGVNFFQILCVHPGLPGQEFQPQVLHSIRHLRKQCPQCIIEADGGMKVGVVKKVVEAGANAIAAASAIFSQPDIKKAIEDLRKEALTICSTPSVEHS